MRFQTKLFDDLKNSNDFTSMKFYYWIFNLFKGMPTLFCLVSVKVYLFYVNKKFCYRDGAMIVKNLYLKMRFAIS